MLSVSLIGPGIYRQSKSKSGCYKNSSTGFWPFDPYTKEQIAKYRADAIKDLNSGRWKGDDYEKRKATIDKKYPLDSEIEEKKESIQKSLESIGKNIYGSASDFLETAIPIQSNYSVADWWKLSNQSIDKFSEFSITTVTLVKNEALNQPIESSAALISAIVIGYKLMTWVFRPKKVKDETISESNPYKSGLDENQMGLLKELLSPKDFDAWKDENMIIQFIDEEDMNSKYSKEILEFFKKNILTIALEQKTSKALVSQSSTQSTIVDSNGEQVQKVVIKESLLSFLKTKRKEIKNELNTKEMSIEDFMEKRSNLEEVRKLVNLVINSKTGGIKLNQVLGVVAISFLFAYYAGFVHFGTNIATPEPVATSALLDGFHIDSLLDKMSISSNGIRDATAYSLLLIAASSSNPILGVFVVGSVFFNKYQEQQSTNIMTEALLKQISLANDKETTEVWRVAGAALKYITSAVIVCVSANTFQFISQSKPIKKIKESGKKALRSMVNKITEDKSIEISQGALVSLVENKTENGLVPFIMDFGKELNTIHSSELQLDGSKTKGGPLLIDYIKDSVPKQNQYEINFNPEYPPSAPPPDYEENQNKIEMATKQPLSRKDKLELAKKMMLSVQSTVGVFYLGGEKVDLNKKPNANLDENPKSANVAGASYNAINNLLTKGKTDGINEVLEMDRQNFTNLLIDYHKFFSQTYKQSRDYYIPSVNNLNAIIIDDLVDYFGSRGLYQLEEDSKTPVRDALDIIITSMDESITIQQLEEKTESQLSTIVLKIFISHAWDENNDWLLNVLDKLYKITEGIQTKLKPGSIQFKSPKEESQEEKEEDSDEIVNNLSNSLSAVKISDVPDTVDEVLNRKYHLYNYPLQTYIFILTQLLDSD